MPEIRQAAMAALPNLSRVLLCYKMWEPNPGRNRLSGGPRARPGAGRDRLDLHRALEQGEPCCVFNKRHEAVRRGANPNALLRGQRWGDAVCHRGSGPERRAARREWKRERWWNRPEDKSGNRPTRAKQPSSRLEHDMGPEEQGVQDDDIPF